MAVQGDTGPSSPGASGRELVGRGPLGFGLVGCGAIGATYAAAFDGLAEARLVAVSDLDSAHAARFADEHGVVDAGSVENLLAMPEVEAVCVLVPSGMHAEMGLAVAEAGRHVVVEKPIDISLVAARRLIDGAAARGVSLSVISQQRYNPGVQRAKALLASGRLGRLVEVWASVPWYRTQAYYDSAQWRGTWAMDGGGALMNQSIHYADLVCWLCGQPEVLSAHCATLSHHIEVEDLALAVLRFEERGARDARGEHGGVPRLRDDASGQRYGGDHRVGERGVGSGRAPRRRRKRDGGRRQRLGLSRRPPRHSWPISPRPSSRAGRNR